MKGTIEVINRMVADRIIAKYAIGGAIGATFYLEPVSTFDLDIFITYRDVPPGPIISLEKIYNYLKNLGYPVKGEHIDVEGWKVQFLPAPNALYEEAVDRAVETDLDGVPTLVMTAEHLMAIALQTGRTKDFLRIEQFISDGVFDDGVLREILEKHALTKKWEAFNEKYAPSK